MTNVFWEIGSEDQGTIERLVSDIVCDAFDRFMEETIICVDVQDNRLVADLISMGKPETNDGYADAWNKRVDLHAEILNTDSDDERLRRAELLELIAKELRSAVGP